jgi:uncharacterized Tic20 family protein
MSDTNATPPYDPSRDQPVPQQPVPPAADQTPTDPGGQASPGAAQPGQASQPGQAQPGQPQPGQPQYGQAQYGQAQYGQAQPGQQPYPAQPAAPLSQADDKLWASLSHFGGILNFVPPLIIWLVLKDRGPLTNQEGKESLNFQITLAIGWVAYGILSIILAFIPVVGWIIGTILWLLLLVSQIVFPIIGGVRVNGGGTYRYPFAIRFIK